MAAAAAAACARRAVGSSSLSNGIKSLSSAAATKTASATSTSARLSRRNLSCISRLPAELGCVQSLMPLHSAIATALLTSELSLKPGSWGWLSETAAGDVSPADDHRARCGWLFGLPWASDDPSFVDLRSPVAGRLSKPPALAR